MISVTRASLSAEQALLGLLHLRLPEDRKSTRLNSSHGYISYAVFCLKKKKTRQYTFRPLNLVANRQGIACASRTCSACVLRGRLTSEFTCIRVASPSVSTSRYLECGR